MNSFWARVCKTETCWLWLGRQTRGGYGAFTLSRSAPNRTRRAHRLAYELTYGKITEGLFVCHSCDNRLCVNPKHLYVANQAKNMADAVARDRMEKGEDRHCAKLTAEKVVKLREDRQTLPLKVIAKKYGISESTASLVARGLKWKHV